MRKTALSVMVIGLGSMGRRRIRLLKTIDSLINIVGIDMRPERRWQAEEEFGIETEETLDNALSKYCPDSAFISTSPLSHNELIRICLENGLNVFSELNLTSEGYDENIKLARKRGKVLFLSSTFLYRKEIQYINDAVDECGCRLSYMYHAGQYLPDWHPWESYKDYFVGDKRTNGCREFMAIEFPWITKVFGRISTFTALGSRDSSLEIDFNDTYGILLEHDTGHKGLILLDIVSRKAVRRLEISGENLYLTWSGTPDSLFRYVPARKKDDQIILYKSAENREGYSAFIIEDAYRSEIENFLNVIKGKESPRYSFERDKEILSLIDQIEKGGKNDSK